MLIDSNTYIGHWPFRQFEYNTFGVVFDPLREMRIRQRHYPHLKAGKLRKLPKRPGRVEHHHDSANSNRPLPDEANGSRC